MAFSSAMAGIAYRTPRRGAEAAWSRSCINLTWANFHNTDSEMRWILLCWNSWNMAEQVLAVRENRIHGWSDRFVVSPSGQIFEGKCSLRDLQRSTFLDRQIETLELTFSRERLKIEEAPFDASPLEMLRIIYFEINSQFTHLDVLNSSLLKPIGAADLFVITGS